ncbi:Uncharacterised protein [Serratia quinivorans]|nr:Uncharacterised protein [Serratia quinivorans]
MPIIGYLADIGVTQHQGAFQINRVTLTVVQRLIKALDHLHFSVTCTQTQSGKRTIHLKRSQAAGFGQTQGFIEFQQPETGVSRGAGKVEAGVITTTNTIFPGNTYCHQWRQLLYIQSYRQAIVLTCLRHKTIIAI